MTEMNGGEIDQKFAPEPMVIGGYLPGATNPRENAMLHQQNMIEQQNRMNTMLGGKRRPKKNRKWQKKGGNGGGDVPMAGQQVEVPQFAPTGPPTGGMGATDISAMANQLKMDAAVSAKYDTMGGGSRRKTSRRTNKSIKSIKSIKSKCRKRCYAISSRRVKKSHFKTMTSLKKTLKAYKKGRKIGFTQKSSLRSMGLIPRSNGCYKLGSKY